MLREPGTGSQDPLDLVKLKFTYIVMTIMDYAATVNNVMLPRDRGSAEDSDRQSDITSQLLLRDPASQLDGATRLSSAHCSEFATACDSPRR